MSTKFGGLSALLFAMCGIVFLLLGNLTIGVLCLCLSASFSVAFGLRK